MHVIGREAELAAVESFLEALSAGPSALVLEGEAGVGKTTLWTAAMTHAEGRGLRVLDARPAEFESALSFSGIGDLLDPVLEAALATLPAGQRSALSRALVLEEAEGTTPDARAVGVAFLNVLRTLADERPVVVAVDDAQWLDPASSDGLAYAARRLRVERVGMLLSRRSGLGSTLLDELRRSLPAERITHVEVGPLERVALHRVVQEHLGIVLPRPLLAEVHQAAGGNPFYALEIVRVLKRTGVSVEAGQPMPVPESLHELVHGRVLALPPESRDYLLAAAAHAHPRTAVVEAASGVGSDAGLLPALEAGIVELDGDRVRFTHPLLAAGVYEASPSARRTQIHARLAELLEDPEARAWQLAASVTERDEDVARVLEESAEHARSRGAPRPAALLLDRARELTPATGRGDAIRRGVEAAYLHFESGDAQRAEAQIREVLAPLGPGLERAKALWVLARIRTYEAPSEAADLFAQVLDEAEEDPETLARGHEGASSCLYYMFRRLDEALEHAERAFVLAVDLGDDALAADVLISRLGAEVLLGRSTAGATAETARVFQETAVDRRVLDQPLVAIAEYLSWTDGYEEARNTLEDVLRRAQELGDESSSPYLLFLLGQTECTVGNLERALVLAREGQEAAQQLGQPMFAAYSVALESLARSQLGQSAEARDAARRALELVPDMGGSVRLVASHALGHLELALMAYEEVIACLEPTVEFVRREGIVEPGAIRFVVDEVEALIALGRREEASELLDWYEGNARRLDRVSALASCVRCRGMLAAGDGKLDEAVAAYHESLELHGKVRIPLDQGRTLLALGAAQRRSKRRREARETLQEALDTFESLGAAIWSERARSELRRIGGRAASPGALTPAEERIAALVAEGKTNRQIAAVLFLSERTVEGHLSRAFAKLGVRSRTELARVLASSETTGVATSNAGDSPVSRGTSSP
jgi:DNA-binding CsgD family transcriptional regulator